MYVPPTSSFGIQSVTLFREFIPKCDTSWIYLWCWPCLEQSLNQMTSWDPFWPKLFLPSGDWVEGHSTTLPGFQWLVIKAATCERHKFTFLSCLFHKSTNPYDLLLRGTVLTNRPVGALEGWGLPQFLLLEAFTWMHLDRDNWMLAPQVTALACRCKRPGY